MDRMKEKVQGWHSRNLSMAERITLSQSVVSALSYYSMRSTYYTYGICSDIDKAGATSFRVRR